MSYLNDYISLLGAFLDGFWDLFLLPLICISFICTVPYMIRCFFKVR